ncbi:MAG: hypothetical protein HC888_03405 [Candidatus Competibacteraceae bacterium]|nr:hypothetical protein [Candidatus Competibacteraceae bacterium]
MPSFYIDIDGNGNEIRTQKGRGPTKNGYTEVEPGLYRKADARAYEIWYVVFGNDGAYQSHRHVSRGRRPSNSVRIKVSDGKYSLCEGESFPNGVDLSTLPSDFFAPVEGVSSIIRAAEPVNAQELAALIKCIKQGKQGNWMSFKGCDFVGEPGIEYFRNNRTHSRIDFDLGNGSIRVWHVVYTPGRPDLTITNALFTEETSKV